MQQTSSSSCHTPLDRHQPSIRINPPDDFGMPSVDTGFSTRSLQRFVVHLRSLTSFSSPSTDRACISWPPVTPVSSFPVRSPRCHLLRSDAAAQTFWDGSQNWEWPFKKQCFVIIAHYMYLTFINIYCFINPYIYMLLHTAVFVVWNIPSCSVDMTMHVPLASPLILEVFALPYGPKTGTMQTLEFDHQKEKS